MAQNNPLLQDDPPPPTDQKGNPTADERADFVLKRIEQFIRDGRTIGEGMSLKRWQDMARFEISNALLEAENSRQEDDVVTKRLLFTMGAALITIGFWGVVFAFDKADYLVTALISGIAGLWLMAVATEWRFRKFWKARKARKRTQALIRIEGLTRRIKKMERELKKEEKDLKKKLKEEFEEIIKEKLGGEPGSLADEKDEPHA